MFVCLFVCLLSSHSRTFHSFEDVTITGEELQILTYARHSRPLSSEGSLACHTYCDTGHPFIWSSPRPRDTNTYCRAFNSGAVNTCFYDLGLSRRCQRSITHCATAAVYTRLTLLHITVTYDIGNVKSIRYHVIRGQRMCQCMKICMRKIYIVAQW